jgi:hypothetical protein
VKSFA